MKHTWSFCLAVLYLFTCSHVNAYYDDSNKNTLNWITDYSILARLKAHHDINGLRNIEAFPACVYDFHTGDALGSADADARLEGTQWALDSWLKAVKNYKGFPIKKVKLDLRAETQEDCDDIDPTKNSMNLQDPQPFRIVKYNGGTCGAHNEYFELRCTIHEVNSGILLHEMGHLFGLGHQTAFSDSDAQHPFGVSSVMNYEHFQSLNTITAHDKMMARWNWLIVKKGETHICPKGYINMNGLSCVPRYKNKNKYNTSISFTDAHDHTHCLNHDDQGLKREKCVAKNNDPYSRWKIKYMPQFRGYRIEKDGQCLTTTESSEFRVLTLASGDEKCKNDYSSIWGIRTWGDKVQIQSLMHNEPPFHNEGCINLSSQPNDSNPILFGLESLNSIDVSFPGVIPEHPSLPGITPEKPENLFMLGRCGEWEEASDPKYQTKVGTTLYLK